MEILHKFNYFENSMYRDMKIEKVRFCLRGDVRKTRTYAHLLRLSNQRPRGGLANSILPRQIVQERQSQLSIKQHSYVYLSRPVPVEIS